MLANTLSRRLVTIPALYAGFLLLSAMLPALLVLAGVVDAVRWSVRHTAAMTLRITVFAWVYLLGECWAVISMAAVGLLPRHRAVEITFRLQETWVAWNFNALRFAFSLDFNVEGTAVLTPGPILLLSRHASLIDTMLPGRYVVKPHGLRLRYVLKKELLIDPALDVGGNRLPNCFVDRDGDTQAALAEIRSLASELGEDEGVLIYPEGTRYTEAKRMRYADRLARRGGRIAQIAKGLKGVLPPRPAGTLALLESTMADVVVLAHRGLEGFARLADIWSGDVTGSVVDVRFWRIPRSSIPLGRDSRIRWLFELWAEVDGWVTERQQGHE